MFRFVSLILSFVVLSGCGDDSSSGSSGSSGDIVAKKVTLDVGNVSPVTIYADSQVGDEYLLHAANITAQYLDNDQDGNWDNENVSNHLSSVKASLFILKQEDKKYLISFLNSLPSDVVSKFMDDDASQSLYKSEMVLCDSHPSFDACFDGDNTKRDASYEEILHLITHVGFSNAETSYFGEEQGSSSVSASMDTARNYSVDDQNGTLCQTESVPTSFGSKVKYDCDWSNAIAASGWFTYDDSSCNYECQVTEYTYWTINAALGMLEHLDGNADYSNEYKCLLRSSFKSGEVCSGDTGLVSIYGTGAIIDGSNQLSAPNNSLGLPVLIPFGSYAPSGSTVEWAITEVLN